MYNVQTHKPCKFKLFNRFDQQLVLTWLQKTIYLVMEIWPKTLALKGLKRFVFDTKQNMKIRIISLTL